MDFLKDNMFDDDGLPEGEMEEETEDADMYEESKLNYKRFGHSRALPIHVEEYGMFQVLFGKEVIQKYRFANVNGLAIEVINFGATIISIRMPDKYGNVADVLLGFDEVDHYYESECKFGSMIGRTANIVADATFQLRGKDYELKKNIPGQRHCKDGGLFPLDKLVWKSYVDRETNSLIMTCFSAHEEGGYPGNLVTKVVMKLSNENEFIVEIQATTDEPTPVDVSPRLYFNLRGHESGEEAIKDHRILINADMYLRQNSEGVPTGVLKHVNQTYFDLRVPRPFHFALDKIRGGGYNHTFCLNKANRDADGMLFAARLEESELGRYVELWTDAPAMYFYTANDLPAASSDLEYEMARMRDPPSTTLLLSGHARPRLMFQGKVLGKGNFFYSRHGAVALSPQCYTNAVNIPEFPTSIIQPHKPFQRKIVYKFGVSDKIVARPRKEMSDKLSKHAENSIFNLI